MRVARRISVRAHRDLRRRTDAPVRSVALAPNTDHLKARQPLGGTHLAHPIEQRSENIILHRKEPSLRSADGVCAVSEVVNGSFRCSYLSRLGPGMKPNK